MHVLITRMEERLVPWLARPAGTWFFEGQAALQNTLALVINDMQCLSLVSNA